MSNGDRPVPELELTLRERALRQLEDEMGQAQARLEMMRPQQEQFVRNRLVAAYGGEPEDWELVSLEPDEQDGWESTWRNGDITLGVVRRGRGYESSVFVDLLADCDEHGLYAAARLVEPTLANLGAWLVNVEAHEPCPLCRLGEAAEETGMTADMAPEAMIGRVILAAVTRTTLAAIQAQRAQMEQQWQETE